MVVERNVPPIPGESFDVITTGNPERVTEDGTTFARLSDGDKVFYRRVNINSDWMAYRVRTDGPVTITLTSGMANMGDRTLQQVWNHSGIARHELIDTGGQWQTIIMDTSGITNRAPHMALMVTGANVDIDYIYFPTTENLILDQIISEPRNFTAVAGDSEVALSWIEPSVGSAFIIDYEVSMDGGQTWLVPDTDHSHTFTCLTNRQIYHFRVRGIADDFNGFAAAAQAEPVRQFTLAPTYATHVQDGANADRIFNEPTMGRSIAGAGRVAYLKFDLTEFDLGNYEYVDAQLNLTIQGGAAGGFIFAESEDVLRENQTSWTINNINYNNQPHIIESAPTIRSAHHAMNSSTYTDLSQIFNHAIREGRESITIQVISDTGAGRDFANTRNDNTSHHPRLTIILGSRLEDAY